MTTTDYPLTRYIETVHANGKIERTYAVDNTSPLHDVILALQSASRDLVDVTILINTQPNFAEHFLGVSGWPVNPATDYTVTDDWRNKDGTPAAIGDQVLVLAHFGNLASAEMYVAGLPDVETGRYGIDGPDLTEEEVVG